MVEETSSSRRMDDQLLLIMDQTSDWTVNGRGGVPLARYHSLRDAVRGVFEYEAASYQVFAVCMQPGDAIILFREQIERIALADRRPELVSHTLQRPSRHSAETHVAGD